MTKEKQIEEMAKAVCENYGSCSKCSMTTVDYDKTCSIYEDCKALYTAGYRKASDVAREIFEEIDNLFKFYIESGIYFEELEDMIAKLKKKYTEEGK